jgi:hypothetical protein
MGDDYMITGCAKCGREGPLQEGELEACIQRRHGMMVLTLCRSCRASTTVEEAFRLLTTESPRRISLLDTIQALTARVELLEAASEKR